MGRGRHTARKASFEITGPTRLNTAAFLYVLLWTKAFFTHRCSIFGGEWVRGERIHLFFLFPGILQKEGKVETLGLKGKMDKAKQRP